MTATRIRSIEIPEDEQGIFASISRLSDPALAGLERALSHSVPTLDRLELISQLRSDPDLKDIGDLNEIVGALVSLAATAYSGAVSVEETIDAVVSVLKSDNVVELTDERAEILKTTLLKLIGTACIELVAKAGELVGANDKTFRSARIITDLRPICRGGDPSIAAGTIVHQLAIRARRNGRTETTYIALDPSDLVELGEAVSRAKKKEHALRDFAARSALPILTPPSE